MTRTSLIWQWESLLPPSFLLLQGSQSRPTPSPSWYPCGSTCGDHSHVLTLQFSPFNWPDNICLCCLTFYPPQILLFLCLFISLLCNLTSSSWFPIFCNNKGKRKFPPSHNCCRRGVPSRAWNWALVWHSETNCLRGHMCWQSKRFYWEGRPQGEQQGKGTQENSSATRLAVSAFMVMALVSSCLQPIILTQSFLVVPCSAKTDAREKDSGRWSDMGCLFLTFPELFRLMVAY